MIRLSRFRALALVLFVMAGSTRAAEFASVWPEDTRRVWAGPDYWANRLQDWQVRDGQLECVSTRINEPMRTVHLLTHRLGAASQPFTISVRTGLTLDPGAIGGDAASGFLIGVGGKEMDYRAAAMVHRNPGPGGGLFAGLDRAGHLFLRSFETPGKARPEDQSPPIEGVGKNAPWREPVTLRLEGKPEGDQYTLILTAHDPKTDRELGRLTREKVDPASLEGGVAVVSNPGTGANAGTFWFRDWKLNGPKVEAHPDRTFGPITSTQYTLSRGILKLTAQLMPIDPRYIPGQKGPERPETVALQVKDGDGWTTIAETEVIFPGSTATFRVEDWDDTKDTPFRVVYQLGDSDENAARFSWTGTIRHDPIEKDTITLAALSCCEQFGGGPRGGGGFPWARRTWFPHADLTPKVAKHDPDLYFFAGDQIYEGNPTPPVRAPLDEAMLDYLYKWYMWCWSFRDLIRDTPCITIPDDHDVFQGNIWGNGGHPSRPGDPSGLFGGYGMPPEWLNMMQRTQTSHLPDPHDPRPAEQGITVYYTSMNFGGIGFAIIEDRKFKSAPAIVDAPMTPDSHIIDPNYDTRKADVPGATLLGDRQLAFLHEFSKDWRGHEIKAVLSQTIFCNLQISSRGVTAGQLDKDLDSNGWPQTGRAKALRELRRGFMVHIAGDQHLASTIHHGIDAFDDAMWSLCVPAIANLYPRFWNPDYPPRNAEENLPPFLGHYEDGFHNKLDVRAVANPVERPEARPVSRAGRTLPRRDRLRHRPVPQARAHDHPGSLAPPRRSRKGPTLRRLADHHPAVRQLRTRGRRLSADTSGQGTDRSRCSGY